MSQVKFWFVALSWLSLTAGTPLKHKHTIVDPTKPCAAAIVEQRDSRVSKTLFSALALLPNETHRIHIRFESSFASAEFQKGTDDLLKRLWVPSFKVKQRQVYSILYFSDGTFPLEQSFLIGDALVEGTGKDLLDYLQDPKSPYVEAALDRPYIYWIVKFDPEKEEKLREAIASRQFQIVDALAKPGYFYVQTLANNRFQDWIQLPGVLEFTADRPLLSDLSISRDFWNR